MSEVPKPKPYTTQQFQKKADLYIKGALGGFDKAEMKVISGYVSDSASLTKEEKLCLKEIFSKIN